MDKIKVSVWVRVVISDYDRVSTLELERGRRRLVARLRVHWLLGREHDPFVTLRAKWIGHRGRILHRLSTNEAELELARILEPIGRRLAT